MSKRVTPMRLGLTVTVALAAFAPASGALAETLDEALIRAYSDHPSLSVAQSALDAARDAADAARAGKGPTVSASASGTMTSQDGLMGKFADSNNLSVNGSWVLWDGGLTDAKINAADVAVKQAEAGVASSEQAILLAAATAYGNVLRDTQNVILAKNNVRLISEQLNAAQQRFKVGAVTRTDVAQADEYLSAARSNLVAAEGTLEVSRQSYLAATNQLPEDLQPVGDLPDIPETRDDAYRIALTTHPDLLDAELSIESAQHALDQARAAYALTVTGSAGVSHSRSTANTSNAATSVSVSANLPLYTGGAMDAGLSQAQANVARVQAARDNVVRQIRAAVASAWANKSAASVAIDARNQQIRAATIAFQSVREEARLGARTTLEVLDAEQDLLDARSALVEAERNHFVATYTLLDAMGLLTMDYLGLEVETAEAAAETDSGPSPLDRALGRW